MKTSREKSHCDATELGPCHPPSRAFVGENAIASVARVAKSVGRPRDEDKQARIDNLLHVAELLFLEKGYDNVSLQMIARSARVAVRTIYVKFGGKVGLLNAVIEAGRARYFAGMVDVETDKRAMIDILADFSLRFLELASSPSFWKLQRMVMSEAERTPEVASAFYRAGPQQTREQLSRFFARKDVAALVDPSFPPDKLAVHLLNCLLGEQINRILFPEERAPGRNEVLAQVDMGLRMFLSGATRRSTTA